MRYEKKDTGSIHARTKLPIAVDKEQLKKILAVMSAEDLAIVDQLLMEATNK